MPFHVRITPKSMPAHDEVRLDLTRQQLEERIVAPYRQGEPITIGGWTILPHEILRILITSTDVPSKQLFPRVRADRRFGNVTDPARPDTWNVAAMGEDVTDEMVKAPPGGVAIAEQHVASHPRDPRAVFVVHGRNDQARDALFTFLRAIGLQPLEWSQAVIATGRPLPYVGDVLDAAFSNAQAVVVLMTPDDEACLREPLRSPADPPHETQLTPQARLNVVFEAGMGMGRFPDRTMLVELGVLRPFSDIGGRHVIRLNNTTQRRQDLAQRLAAAGCPVDLSGTDWHTAGTFAVGAESH
jgi:predicted nucleotide-binding protein